MKTQQKLLQGLMAIVLVVSLIAPAALMAGPAPAAATARLQPLLVEMASTDPDQLVRVIVQKAGRSDQPERLVAALGGRMFAELHLINSFAAELPAGQLGSLARLDTVSRVSIDAPVVSTASSLGTLAFRDEFNQLAFNGNDGTIAWNSDWQEIAEADGATEGRIRVVPNGTWCAIQPCLRVGGTAGTNPGFGVSREANLTGFTNAYLIFSYRRGHYDGGGSPSGATLRLSVSKDGGVNWLDLKTFSFDSEDLQQVKQYVDISDAISSHTQIRFLTEGSLNDRVFFIDNLEISGDLVQLPEPSDPHTENFHLHTLGVQQVWDMGFDGDRIGVAIIDSGVSKEDDFGRRVKRQVSFNPNSTNVHDVNGHGTHVAGIVGGDGGDSNGAYAGVAPGVHLIGLKISDDSGMAYESDTVDAMEWVLDNRDKFDIRVVNLSIQSTVEQSYHDSPLSAAAEILWFNGIVVVAASGNKGAGGNFNTANAAPANDPFIITVGASDEQGTAAREDDTIASFSAFGTTLDGYVKPEIIAPGKDIISVLAGSSDWQADHPDRVVANNYFRISGTSMAAPMVTGAVALLLQAEPDLTPDQVKYRLINTAGSVTNNHGVLYPYLNVYAALTTPTTESANPGVIPHMLLAKMAMIAYWSSQNGEENIDWASVDWDTVNWEAVDWEAVNWNAVNWNAVNWNAVNWNAVNWNAVNWNAVNWNAVNWNAVNWNAVNWNAVNWNAVSWN